MHWASQLQAGDELWYQRCEGGHVQACVVETCPGSNACWVEYYVKRPQGGRQHRRALVKLDELARIQREHGELHGELESLLSEEADANCAMSSDNDSNDALTRELRTFSMVIDSEDDASHFELPRRAYSMLFGEDDPQQRTSAFSMLCGSEDELSERDEHLQSRPRAFSMLWSDELDAIPEQSEASQTESEVSKQSYESDPDLARSSEESGSDDHRDECKSGASQRSTASPDSESPSNAYGEEDFLWPSAQWTLPELVGLEPGQVELFCGSAPDGCTNCCKALAGHTVYKVEAELNELCRILQMKAAFLEGEDGELPEGLEGEMKAWIYAEDPESEELDPCRAFEVPSGSEEAGAVAAPGPDTRDDASEPTPEPPGTEPPGTEPPRPKKKAGLVARAWALLGCQSGAKAGRVSPPKGTGSSEPGEAAERSGAPES